ncbi:hypothetical protein KSP39_PZI015887 [Platanthera zijinensis]|uniref:VOC domain-containing protein n=1 Tax=Platanthera zijinensis TaxID=2320716 RepID=A0AAP0B8E5_9ASPA
MAQEGAVNTEQINGDSSKAVTFISFKPQLVLSKAEEAIKFYKAAFGAEELSRVNHPKRKAEQDLPLIICADLKIGTSSFLVCDQTDDLPLTVDGAGLGFILKLETEDVVAAVEKAVEAGAVADGEVTEVEGLCGGLLGKVKDPFGFVWVIALASNKCSETEA